MDDYQSYTGTVTRGKFIPDDPVTFREAFNQHEGERVLVSVERKRNTRGRQSNKYLFKVVYGSISKFLGIPVLIVHELMKRMFNFEAELIIKPRSTATLTDEYFWWYIDEIRFWAADFLELDIPDPINIKEM